MKLLLLVLTAACLQVTARTEAQPISISVQNAPLEKVIFQIEAQSSYRFVYSQQAIAVSKPVTLTVKNEGISSLLKRLFDGQQLSYTINDHFIILKINVPVLTTPALHEVRGKVINEDGLPVPGITIKVKGTNISVVTDANGDFYFKDIDPAAILIISGAETTLKEVPLESRTRLSITVETKVGELDQVVMTAYGITTKKLNVGNITKVTAEEIERQPVTNPLAALQGRVPGMIITQSSGNPGSAFKVEIRGRSSLDAQYSRNDPLFVIDGIPFEPGNISTNLLPSAANTPNSQSGGLSPLNTINPADIESIEVLKDADATAIYGSRGANGVILITTKKGVSGKLKISVNVTAGFNLVTRTLDMLNTGQYLSMRREAFRNDGVTPTLTNAPDLLAWDTTHYTDYRKKFQGNTARNQAFQISASGGSSSTQFRIGMGYTRQSNVFSNELSDQVISSHFSINHSADEGKLRLTLSGGYSVDDNKMIRDDLSRYKNLPPHVQLNDSVGNLIWNAGGVEYSSVFGTVGNPLALLLRKYSSQNENLFSNFTIAYSVKKFNFRINFGYNTFTSDEVSNIPKRSTPPASNGTGSSFFANSHSKSWITEPQLEFKSKVGKGKLILLAGGTLQERTVQSEVINATNYASDVLLNSIAAAGTLSASNSEMQYRYMALFGRASYNLADKYLANLSYRVDGSSRFGPDKRFSSFGAVGAGWIFSKESFFGFASKILSFGKLRASYGVTGNDQIDNYRYFDLWSNTSPTYQGIPGLYPTNLFNPDYNWERNRKSEVGVELGFFKDRLLFSASYYRNRSGNQLVQYKLPVQAGFSNIVKNLDALVQNTGLECVIGYRSKGKVRYSGSVNFSIPNNKLISFPGLASSSYANTYREGMSLSVTQNHQYTGVSDSSGLYSFVDLNKDGVINSKDYVFNGNTDAKIYGGIQNEVSWKNLELAVFFEFKVQQGPNYLMRVANDFPGRFGNQPILVLQRWQKTDDHAPIQRFSQSTSGAAATANANFINSDGTISDASFVRCKNLSLHYNFPQRFVRKFKLDLCRVFILTQNLFVFTRYKGSDPETQDFFVLPPLKTVVAGVKINF